MSLPLYFVGPWDLHPDLACVPPSPTAGTVVLIESRAKGSALPYHRKKLVMILSAMHHFAEDLRARGYTVDVVRAETYVDGIQQTIDNRGATEVHALTPREWGLAQALEKATFSVPLHLHEDGGPGGHFLLTKQEALDLLSAQKKTLRMDVFYRAMRKRFGVLMAEGKPEGGKWSYDADNRKPAKGVTPPPTSVVQPTPLTQKMMERVSRWPNHWGQVDGFDWPVTRAQALTVLSEFLDQRLPQFGDYQDAMLNGEVWMWHARLSTALNLSLLHPMELIAAVEARYAEGRAPLNAVEGLIRQILGWREFIRAVYWRQMPGMRSANHLQANRPLPKFFWEPERTKMKCMSEALSAVKTHGYAHHIQRLMILGNFALLAEVDPIEVSHWFWAGFVDAYEWVELPNVHGMALYADPSFTTKPYAASGNYINKMSNHCRGCHYKVKDKTGPTACPFNPLFWNFMVRHRELLTQNPRLSRLYGNWDRKTPEAQQEAIQTAQDFLDSLEPSDHGWSFHDDAC